jgi:hypothetical protein
MKLSTQGITAIDEKNQLEGTNRLATRNCSKAYISFAKKSLWLLPAL